MKKTLTLLLTLCMGTSLLIGQGVPPALEKVSAGGEDYWVLYTPTDLIWLCDTTATKLDANGDGVDDFDSIQVKMDANYRLGANIVFDADPTKVDWNNDGEVNVGADTLGLQSCGGDGSPRFTGHFDGRNYAIENIFKEQSTGDRNRAALFGSIEGATIENLYVLNFNYRTKASRGGGVVGAASYGGPNILRRLYTTGVYDSRPRFTVSGSKHVRAGGIIGLVQDTEISECASMITFINTDEQKRIGGIAGVILENVSIKNCYALPTLSADRQVGGILGENDATSASIENCYAAGHVGGTLPREADGRGSFAGDLGAIIPVSCYYDSDLDSVGVGKPYKLEAVVGLPTASFASAASFVGWDFTDTWKIGDVDGTQRPTLKWLDDGPIVGNPEKEMANRSMIKVYPNPATSNLTIENAPVNAEYMLINLIGQIQESGIITNGNMVLNLGNYQKGIYMLKVGDSVSKIMVQ